MAVFKDNHDIINVNSKNLYSATNVSPGKKPAFRVPPPEKRVRESGGWGWFLLKTVVFIVVVVGGYVGYTAYRAQYRSSRF